MLATGSLAADILGQTDQQGMVFIEYPGITGQIIHKKSPIGNVAITIRSQAETAKDTASISIDNENRLASSIQYYRIGCLLSDAVDRKKLPSEVISIPAKQLIEVISVVFPQPVSQGLKL